MGKFDLDQLKKLSQLLQRIFSLKVSRSTFREVQNVLVQAAQGDKEIANEIYKSLSTGAPPEFLENDEEVQEFQSLIDSYAVPVRLAREVTERAEYIGIITSDMVTHGDMPAFLNRIRRIDGEEFSFITDVDSTMQLLHHFLTRMGDMASDESANQVISSRKKQLEICQGLLEGLMERCSGGR